MRSDTNTVLVVEDERDLCDLYRAWLSPEYEVRTAGTLADARSTLDASVDVVLLDRRLPDGRGDDLLVDIADRELACRVAMLTGVEPDFDIIDLGFDAYLVKPVDRETVRETVDRLLTLETYTGDMRTYFRLASKKAALESAKTRAELERTPEYRELEARLTELDENVTGAVNSLTDPSSMRVLFRDLESPSS